MTNRTDLDHPNVHCEASDKLPYSAPVLTIHGPVQELTMGPNEGPGPDNYDAS